MDSQLNIAVLGSGRGSNFRALLGAIGSGDLPGADVRVVVSNNSNAGILGIARRKGIPAVHLSERQFSDQGAFASCLLATLRDFDVNFIVLAGYMKRIPEPVIKSFRHRIINIHPALLPKFGGKGMYGMNVHEAVIQSGDKISGASVHIVSERYDEGPVIVQETVAVEQGDTPESLAEKVLEVEHRLLPLAVRMFAEGRVEVNQNGVVVHQS